VPEVAESDKAKTLKNMADFLMHGVVLQALPAVAFASDRVYIGRVKRNLHAAAPEAACAP